MGDRDLSYQSDLLALSAPTAPGRRFVRKQAKDLQLIETYLDSEAEKEKEKRKDHSHGSRRRTLKEDYTEYEDEAQEDDLLADIAKSHVKQEQGVLAKVKPTTAAGARARHAQSQLVKKTKSAQKELERRANAERQRENNERERQNCRSAHQSTQARRNAGESPRTLPATTARCKQLLGIPRG